MLSPDSAPLSLVKRTHPAVKWKVSMCELGVFDADTPPVSFHLESCPESNKVFLYFMDSNNYSAVLSYKILGFKVMNDCLENDTEL